MPALPQSNIHLDILMGRDEALEPADFFGGTSPLPSYCSRISVLMASTAIESGPSMDIHADMEKKRRI
jgi:proteasome maturation protein